MKNLIQAAVVTLVAASAAHAQQAVQWRVQDGGNGHWYAFDATLTGWQGARSIALGLGGDLASLASDAERTFWMSRIPIGAGAPGCAGCTWLGGFQDRLAPDYAEPTGGWRWSDGTQWSYTFWNAGEPNNLNGQDYLYGSGPTNGRWDDSSGACCAPFVVEWSADCNNDGIVDYGQCRDGSLPDYNGNNVPDCCEAGTPCAVGNYPVQWRTAEGGNGRWYQVSLTSSPIRWADARDAARSQGGQLISVNSAEEQSFIEPLLVAAVDPEGCNPALFMGLTKVQGQSWRWEDGATLAFTNWACGEPADPDYPAGKMVMFNPAACEPYCVPHLRWNDIQLDNLHPLHRGLVIEWSADCNNDGIVDKGQILRGQLQDANGDGVPDVCQQPTCRDADIVPDGRVGGDDLGVLLVYWGPATSAQFSQRSDINRDGFVNGDDLGFLLTQWGPCAN